jgi:flagellar assembly protein FliH
MANSRRRTLIPAGKASKLQPYTFRAFEQRPVNYFKDMIVDSTTDSETGANEDLEVRLTAQNTAEKQLLAAQFEHKCEEQYLAGLEKGREESGAEISRALDLLSQYGQLLRQEKQELSARYENEVIELAFQIARQILGRELEQKPESVADIAREAVRQVMGADEVTLRVNPEDLGYLRSVQGELKELLSGSARIEIKAEATVERGGCIVETESGMLDARLASQLTTLKSNLGFNTEIR